MHIFGIVCAKCTKAKNEWMNEKQPSIQKINEIIENLKGTTQWPVVRVNVCRATVCACEKLVSAIIQNVKEIKIEKRKLRKEKKIR